MGSNKEQVMNYIETHKERLYEEFVEENEEAFLHFVFDEMVGGD